MAGEERGAEVLSCVILDRYGASLVLTQQYFRILLEDEKHNNEQNVKIKMYLETYCFSSGHLYFTKQVLSLEQFDQLLDQQLELSFDLL